jgi:hypothetical protein
LSFSTPNTSSNFCTGDTKPIANNTKSALMVNSVPATSTIFPSSHSTLAPFKATTLPFSPISAFVVIDQSRFAPSSCELEVRILSGQFGHTSSLFSCIGGCGINSN